MDMNIKQDTVFNNRLFFVEDIVIFKAKNEFGS
jgi:hypothetical protein